MVSAVCPIHIHVQTIHTAHVHKNDQDHSLCIPLRKHAYSNILKNLPPKNENFKIKYYDIFHISVQNIDCGYSLEPPRRGGSNEYPQSMFLSRNKKNNVYPCEPQFYYIKVGFKGVKFISVCYRDAWCVIRICNCLRVASRSNVKCIEDRMQAPDQLG